MISCKELPIMKKVRYVIVGFGEIADERIAREGYACDRKRFKPLTRAELVGVTSRSSSRRAAVEALGLTWYDSYAAVLADKSVDGVYIATNNATHAKLTLAALKAGKHVIIEKPAATSLADARAMNRLAKAKGLSLTIDHMMVHNSWSIAGKAAVAKGRLGKVNDCCFHMEFPYGYVPAEAKSWRCEKVEEVGGPIGDVASHCLYMAEFMLGKRIRKVAAVYYPKTMKIKCEDGAYIKFWFEDGTQGSVKVAFSEPRGGLVGILTNQGYEIYGDKAVMRSYGTLFQLSGHPDETIVQRQEIDDGKKVVYLTPKKIQNIYQTLIEAHAKSVQDGKPLTGDDAVHNLELCMIAHKSAKNGGKTYIVPTHG